MGSIHLAMSLSVLAPLVSQTVRSVPGTYPQIGGAIAAAQPGDVIEVASGSYLPFSCGKAVVITAQPNAIVTIQANSFSGTATTDFTIPAGSITTVQGLRFVNPVPILKMRVAVLGGHVAFENCSFEAEPYADAGLRVSNAAVWLRNCRAAGHRSLSPFTMPGNLGPCAGLLAVNSFVAAVDCEFVAGDMLADGSFGAGDGVRSNSSLVHLVRCAATGGGSASSFYPNGHGLTVLGTGGTWLVDVTLRGGSHPQHPTGGDALHNASAVPVHLTRVATIPGAGIASPGLAIFGPTLADSALGLGTATVDVRLGSPYRIDYLTDPNVLIGVFLSDTLSSLPPTFTVEPTWLPGNSPFVTFLLTDTLGAATFQTSIPNVPGLRYRSFWLHSAAWPAPLHVSPPIGGLLL